MYATITSLVLMYVRIIIPGGMSIPSPAVLAPLGWGLWASWQVLVRVAKSAAPGVFGRERNSGPRAAVRTIQVDIQYVRGCHHWPEGVLNDKGLRVAKMAGEQLLLLYHLS